MNGLEGKRGKKTRHEGGERGEGMTERGMEQWKGSSPGQSPAQHSCYFRGCTAKERCDPGESLVLAQGESAAPEG